MKEGILNMAKKVTVIEKAKIYHPKSERIKSAKNGKSER